MYYFQSPTVGPTKIAKTAGLLTVVGRTNVEDKVPGTDWQLELQVEVLVLQEVDFGPYFIICLI